MAESYDLLIKGATIVNHDGEGVRDLAIKDGRIAALGQLGSAKAAETIDAKVCTFFPASSIARYISASRG